MDVTNIPNAPHWLNHSVVIVKEDYLAEDAAKVLHALIRLNENNELELPMKHQDIVKVQHMVQPGSVVAVPRSNGRVKTCKLPEETTQLLWDDLQYILKEIEKLSAPPMTKKEQEDFPKPASEHLQANLRSVR